MQPPPLPEKPRVPRPLLFAGIGLGLVYGLCARLTFGYHAFQSTFGVMTVGFLFFVPFGLGFLCVYIGDSKGAWTWPQRLLIPWIAAAACMAAALCLAWEGIICIFLWLPLFLIMTLIGSAIAGFVRDYVSSRIRPMMLACCLMLPFVITPIERRIPAANSIRTVSTAIEIDADAATIWNRIKRVPPIAREEQRRTLTQWLGFPRPIEATLSHEGAGAIRHASFEGNVVFVETVNVWEPDHRLAFSIRADTSAIPATTLDEHVTVGGPFFDVLNGEYRIQVLGPRRAILHLSSQHRLSTHFNFYAGLWTEFIMRDIQNNILYVIKNRCDRRMVALAK